MGFDALGYYEKLRSVGFTDEHAKVLADTQAQAWREYTDAQTAAFKAFAREQEEKTKNELATKGNLRETELRLLKEIREVEIRLLKWQWGIALALAAIMAKGFGWLGF